MNHMARRRTTRLDGCVGLVVVALLSACYAAGYLLQMAKLP